MVMRLILGGLLLGAASAALAQPTGWEILVRKGAKATTAFAAAELSRYAQQVFERPFPCVPTADLDRACVLVLTKMGGAAALPAGLAERAAALGPDGFVIRTVPNGIVFAGGSPRGLLFGVYTFLEQCLGCRWYYPSPEDQIVPQHGVTLLDKLVAKGIDAAETPDFIFREREVRDCRPMTDVTDDRIIEQIDWWAKLRMNCFLVNFHYAHDEKLWARWKKRLIPEIKKRGLLLGIGEHGSYRLFLNPKTYAKDHPDWYCELGGRRIDDMTVPNTRKPAQFCTSNEEAVRTYLDAFVSFARANPEIDVYYPAPNDGGAWCKCARCRKKSVADRYLELDNRIAEALCAVRADYRVLHLAYANHRLPPKHTKPHPNVDVDVACWGRDFAYPLSDPRTMRGKKDYLDVFHQWIALCRGTGSRVVYHCKFMRHLWLGLHLMPLQVVKDDMPHLRKMGLSGFDLPLGFVGIWTKAPNAYVVARKCWDADADFDGLVGEYFTLYYRECAADARRACDLVEEALPELRYGSNYALIWRRELLAPRMGNPRGLLEHAVNAMGKLAEALTQIDAAEAKCKDETVRSRLRKLRLAVEQARREQEFLGATAEQAERLKQAEQPLTTQQQKALRAEAATLLDRIGRSVKEMKTAYSEKHDLAGVLWAGGSYGLLLRAESDWRAYAEGLLAGLVWTDAATWRTDEFPDKHTVIAKEIDITDRLTAPGPVFVRWRWTGGQLGIVIHGTSLWEVADGKRSCVCKDEHAGFTGAADRRAVYHLELKRRVDGARYLIVGRIQARAGHGTVAERGTRGEVLVGARSGTEPPGDR